MRISSNCHLAFNLVHTLIPCKEVVPGDRTCEVGDQSTVAGQTYARITPKYGPSTFSMLYTKSHRDNALIHSLQSVTVHERHFGIGASIGSWLPQA